MEQNREPRNKPTHMQSTNICLIRILNGEKIISSTNCVGKTGYSPSKELNWTSFLHDLDKLI